MNKQKILIRTIFIIIGIAITALIIYDSILHTKDMWFNEGMCLKYESFEECYFTRNKGSLVLAVVSGIIPIGIGLWITSD